MKMCPACGADILDSATVTCSSCGADTTVKKPSKTHDDMQQDSNRSDDTPRKERLDDTSPIQSSDDLEVVQSGQAFWAEARETAQAQRDSEETEMSHGESKEPKDSKDPKVATMFDKRESDTGPAPSLADLARQRREEMAQESPASDTDSESGNESDETVHDQHGAAKDADDTDPAGVETAASQPTPEPSVKVVSRSPDVAFIEGQQLLVPGVRWTTGESIVIQGKTFQLKRRVHKYPLSPKMAAYIGGSFVLGCLLMWLIATGDSAPNGHIFGAVREAGSGNMLPGVTVAIEDGGRTSESDPGGMFLFDELNDGIYTLIATDPIYGKQRRTVTVSGGTASIMLDLGA